MSNYFLLFKVLVTERLRVLTAKKNGKSFWWVWLIIGIVFVPILIGIMIGMYSLGVESLNHPDVEGLRPEYILSTFSLVGQVIVLIFGLVSLLNVVYFSRDSGILLPLPVKPQTMFLSKLTYVYGVELATSLGVAVVAFLPFGIGASLGISFFLLLPVAVLMIPLLPLLAASIVAIPLMYILSYFRRRGVLSTVILLALFSAAFLVYYFILGSVTGGTGGGEDEDFLMILINGLSKQFKALGSVIPPNLWLSRSMSAGTTGEKLLNFLASVGVHGALFLGAFLISSTVYSKSISKQLENAKAVSAKGEITYGSVEKQLMLNDFKRIVRFPALGLNCFMQSVLTAVIVVGMSFMMQGMDSEEFSFASLPESVTVVLPIGIATFMIFMTLMLNVVATSAFSREGETFKILKYIPISAETIIASKQKLAMLFNALSVFISVVAVSIVLRIGVIDAVLMFLYLNVMGMGTAALGVYFDLSKPRLKWKSINEAVKNNRAQLFVMAYAFAHIIINVIVISTGYVCYTIAGKTAFYLTWIVLFIIAIAAYAIIKKIMASNAQRLYDSIEC